MEFDSDANEVVFLGPLMEIDEGNIIEHTNSIASRPPNAQREMELIHSWVNNPDAVPSSLIEWPSIGASPINEYVTFGLLDMYFPTLFLDGSCDWLEPRMELVYLHEFVKHLIKYMDHRFGMVQVFCVEHGNETSCTKFNIYFCKKELSRNANYY